MSDKPRSGRSSYGRAIELIVEIPSRKPKARPLAPKPVPSPAASSLSSAPSIFPPTLHVSTMDPSLPVVPKLPSPAVLAQPVVPPPSPPFPPPQPQRSPVPVSRPEPTSAATPPVSILDPPIPPPSAPAASPAPIAASAAAPAPPPAPAPAPAPARPVSVPAPPTQSRQQLVARIRTLETSLTTALGLITQQGKAIKDLQVWHLETNTRVSQAQVGVAQHGLAIGELRVRQDGTEAVCTTLMAGLTGAVVNAAQTLGAGRSLGASRLDTADSGGPGGQGGERQGGGVGLPSPPLSQPVSASPYYTSTDDSLPFAGPSRSRALSTTPDPPDSSPDPLSTPFEPIQEDQAPPSRHSDNQSTPAQVVTPHSLKGGSPAADRDRAKREVSPDTEPEAEAEEQTVQLGKRERVDDVGEELADVVEAVPHFAEVNGAGAAVSGGGGEETGRRKKKKKKKKRT